MGVEPDVAWAVGDQKRPRRRLDGTVLGGLQEETYWAYGLVERADAELVDAITAANRWLEQRSAFVGDFLRSGGDVDYYVTVYSKDRLAAEVSLDVLAACVRLGVRLGVEILFDRAT